MSSSLDSNSCDSSFACRDKTRGLSNAVFSSRVSNRLVSAQKPFDYAEFPLEMPSIAHEDGEESGNLFPACLTS